MAATAIALHLRPTHRTTVRNPSFIHFFSSSTSDSNNAEDPNTPSSSPPPPPPPQPQSSFSSHFSDVKESLKQPQQQHQPQPPPRGPFPLSSTAPPSAGAPSKIASSEEIRKNLAELRRRDALRESLGQVRSNAAAKGQANDDPMSPPLPPSSSQHISFQELYKRNVIPKGGSEDSANDTGKRWPSLEAISESLRQARSNDAGKSWTSLEAIRESLRQVRSNAAAKGQANDDPMSFSKFKESLKLRPVDPLKGGSLEGLREILRQLLSNAAAKGQANDDSISLSKFKESLKLRPVDPSKAVFGGTDKLPQSVFGKEMREKKHGESPAMKTEFVKMYSYEELGKKLRILRPEAKGGDWFSLKELNERLMKLREMEESERTGGVWLSDLRQSLMKLQISDDEKKKNKNKT